MNDLRLQFDTDLTVAQCAQTFRMAVHAYVIDNGRSRTVELVGSYGMGEKGSTSRLLQSVASGFGAHGQPQ